MIALLELVDKDSLITVIQLTDHWYEAGNYWNLRDGYVGKLKFGSGKYDRVPGNFLTLYASDTDASQVRVARINIAPAKYPFSKGYKNTGNIYHEAALSMPAGAFDYEVISVW